MLTEYARIHGMSVEYEIKNALLQQSSDLLEVISTCNYVLMNSLLDIHPSFIFESFRDARLALERAEAIHSALIQRSGVSWDVMSSRAGGAQKGSPVSRQAMHRRLAVKGESIFQMAQDFPDINRGNIARAVLSVPPKPKEILKLCAARTNEIMEAKAKPHWWLQNE